MFFDLKHQHLDVFRVSKKLVLACYQVSQELPDVERYGLKSQIRRAAVSIHLNIAEGCSRRTAQERKRFYEISRSSLIEVDAALDLAVDLLYIENIERQILGDLMTRTFYLLSAMIKNT